MKTQINRSQIFKAAWKQVKATGVSISLALKFAWMEAKKVVSVSAENIATYANNIAACYAIPYGVKGVEVIYRGKRSDKVIVNLITNTVEFTSRAAAQVAGQIAKEFNLKLVY